jgi:hypothetical protein
LLARGTHAGGPSVSGFVIFGIAAVFSLYMYRRRMAARDRPQNGQSGYAPPLISQQGSPGWYPDANDPTLMRYFDGQSWTSDTQPRE